MLTIMWFLAIVAVWLLCLGCSRGPRVSGVSWFVILPQMQEPTKKAKGRMQQRRKRRR